MSKKNLILGGILIALVAFIYIWSGPAQDWKASRGKEKTFLAGVSAATAGRIVITANGEETILQKKGERWQVGDVKDFYLSKELASALNTFLSEASLEKLEMVGAASANKSSFGTDDQGIAVEISGGGETTAFIVGKNTPNYIGTYISPAVGEKTYAIGLDLKSFFGRDEWRDQAIFSFMKERAEKIRFQVGKSNFTVERKENKWVGTVPRNFPVAEEKIIALLGVLEKLTAAKIPVQDFKGTGLEKNGLIIQVVGEGFDNTLMVGDCAKDELCYAKRGDSDNIYLIVKAQKDALNKKMTDLK
jgi:hypothetical protein